MKQRTITCYQKDRKNWVTTKSNHEHKTQGSVCTLSGERYTAMCLILFTVTVLTMIFGLHWHVLTSPEMVLALRLIMGEYLPQEASMIYTFADKHLIWTVVIPILLQSSKKFGWHSAMSYYFDATSEDGKYLPLAQIYSFLWT